MGNTMSWHHSDRVGNLDGDIKAWDRISDPTAGEP